MKKWKMWKESCIQFLSKYSKRTIGITIVISVVSIALLTALIGAGVTTIKQRNEAKKDLSGSSVVVQNATATPNSSSLLELESGNKSDATNSTSPTQTPLVTVEIDENTIGTIDNPNLTIDDQGNYVASNVPDNKKEEYKETIDKTNNQMKDSNSNGVLQEGAATGEVTDNTDSLGGQPAAPLEPEPQPENTPSNATPIFDGNYSDSNLPEYLYTYPLTKDPATGTTISNEELKNTVPLSIIDATVQRARDYINVFYNISYKDIESDEQYNSKLNEILDFYHPNGLWKDYTGNKYGSKDYIQKWLDTIYETKTTIIARYYTNNDLTYGDTYSMVRGVFEFQIISSVDTSRLLNFTKFISNYTNTYEPARLNTKYRYGTEFAFAKKGVVGNSEWFPSDKTISKYVIYHED